MKFDHLFNSLYMAIPTLSCKFQKFLICFDYYNKRISNYIHNSNLQVSQLCLHSNKILVFFRWYIRSCHTHDLAGFFFVCYRILYSSFNVVNFLNFKVSDDNFFCFISIYILGTVRTISLWIFKQIVLSLHGKRLSLM